MCLQVGYVALETSQLLSELVLIIVPNLGVGHQKSHNNNEDVDPGTHLSVSSVSLSLIFVKCLMEQKLTVDDWSYREGEGMLEVQRVFISMYTFTFFFANMIKF